MGASLQHRVVYAGRLELRQPLQPLALAGRVVSVPVGRSSSFLRRGPGGVCCLPASPREAADTVRARPRASGAVADERGVRRTASAIVAERSMDWYEQRSR